MPFKHALSRSPRSPSLPHFPLLSSSLLPPLHRQHFTLVIVFSRFPLSPALCPYFCTLHFFPLVMVFLSLFPFFFVPLPVFPPAVRCIMLRLRLYLLLAGDGVCSGQICFSATLIVEYAAEGGRRKKHWHAHTLTCIPSFFTICRLHAAVPL